MRFGSCFIRFEGFQVEEFFIAFQGLGFIIVN